MSAADLPSLLPYLVLAAGAVAELLGIAWGRSHAASAWICAIALVLSFAALFVAAPSAPRAVTPLLMIDGYALFYIGLVVLSALAVALLSHGYLRERTGKATRLKEGAPIVVGDSAKTAPAEQPSAEQAK